jgi:hypothetical protein
MAHEWLEAGSVADRLLERFGDQAASQGSPVWLAVGRDGGFDTLEIDRPEGLLGYVVGDEWPAVAVIGTGRFRALDDTIELSAACRSGIRGGLRLACVVTRTGDIGWRLELPDGTSFAPVPEEGVTLDVLRRSLRLPTAAPSTTTRMLYLASWLKVVLDSAIDGPSRLGWDDLVDIHMTEFGFPLLEGLDPWVIVDMVCEPIDWESLRLEVAHADGHLDGHQLCPECFPPPDLADWMDAGMFERWVMRDMPSVPELMKALRSRLRSSAFRRICRMAHDLGRIGEVA